MSCECVCVYRIARNIQGRNFCGSVGSENFAEKTFTECYIIHVHVSVWSMPNFVEKTFAGGSQGATMGKVTELSTHLVCETYDIVQVNVYTCTYTCMYVRIPTFTCSCTLLW